jgi:hypothetical protein
MTTTERGLNTRKFASKEIEVTHPGWFGRTKWAIMRGLLSTIGRTSQGIQIGYQYGFDSGSMLDYVYLNKAHGSWGIGKLIDRFYINAIGWRAIRARRVLLKQMLYVEIERNSYYGRTTRLLDVAGGPGRYLQEVLQISQTQKHDLCILCRDLSLDGITQGAAQAKKVGLTAISYEQGDAFNPAPTEAGLGGNPNIIVVSGLYELLLNDTLIQRSLTQLYDMLEPGGAIYFTTQTHHPQLEFIANVLPNRDGLPWVMKCRPVSQLEAWTRQAGFSEVYSKTEKVGLFTVTVGRKSN